MIEFLIVLVKVCGVPVLVETVESQKFSYFILGGAPDKGQSMLEPVANAKRANETVLELEVIPGVQEGVKASKSQVGGSHYKDFAIQPAEFIHRNGIGFLAANVIKYVCRYKAKNGRQDLEKARHYIDLLLEFEYGQAVKEAAAIDRMNGLKTPGNGVDD